MAHAKCSLSHEENRFKVCAVCFQKAKYTITDTVLSRIREFFTSNYDLSNNHMPAGICSKCRSDLLDISNGKKTQDSLPSPYPFHEIQPHTVTTRADPIPCCSCDICHVATQSGKSMPKRKPGRPSNVSEELDSPKSITICGQCKSPYGKGLRHKCSVSSLRENILNMCDAADENTQGIVACSLLHKSSSSSTKHLYSGGPRPLKVDIVSAKKSSSSTSTASFEDISNLQCVMSASNNEMKRKIVPFVRNVFGRKSVDSDIATKLHMRDEDCVDFFDSMVHDFECIIRSEGDECVETQPLVYCKDIAGLIDFICDRRDFMKESVNIKLGIDSGGGFLKFCLNLTAEENQQCSQQPRKLIEKSMLHSGVKKIIIVAIAPDVAETYSNVRFILNVLKIDEIDLRYVCAVDLKMANILCGIQSHSCTYPCAYCCCPKPEFSDQQKSKSYHMRTIGEVRALSHDFQIKRRQYNNKASAKDFKSCVNPPIIRGEDTMMMIKLIPPPELHLLLRVVNKIFKELKKSYPHFADRWLQKMGLQQPMLHGGEFTGNMCRSLLKNANLLADLANGSSAETEIAKYVSAFSNFCKVVEASFGRVLHPDFETYVASFQRSYCKLRISVTTAVHIVFVHLPQFCKLMHTSLGPFSEQASESVHHDFKTMWSMSGTRQKRGMEEKLLSCVVRYNSRHI